jgi:4-hydroxy-2-oxoheptanedioate aldolase
MTVRGGWAVTIAAALAVPAALALAQAPHRVNPLVELLEQKKPVFGLYAPANARGRRGEPPSADAPPAKSPAQLALDALSHAPNDYIFDGSMEGDFERGYANFSDFVKGALTAPLEHRRAHPLVVKTHVIAENPTLAAERIARQLDLGVSTVVFVGVESADEVKKGLAAMRFKSSGGTRADGVGGAPAYWGLGEKEYKEKADVWPLNPRGELLNWTIVESKEGLAHVREIAAVRGIGVLFPGAGTLRGVFSETDASGQRQFDQDGWEKAIQQVLAACKEFKVPCGFPANTPEVMEPRLKEGFSVFVIGWGENGFRTVEAGLKASGRPRGG